MKTNESITSDLKNKMGTEMSNSGVLKNGSEGMMVSNEFIKGLDEDKDVIIKKHIKKNNTDKLVNKTKLKTPVGKLTMGLPIMGEDSETSESTGSGSAGGFEAPLFSDTKEGKEGDVKKVEATESTGSGSSGSYETTAFLAKSQNKKDWRGKSKTQIPGGKFVQVKEKCKKFPYCNQGDIKALKIFENEKVKKAIQNISKKHNISENVIKTIIAYEYENTFSKQ
jgi:hypothetical protein